MFFLDFFEKVLDSIQANSSPLDPLALFFLLASTSHLARIEHPCPTISAIRHCDIVGLATRSRDISSRKQINGPFLLMESFGPFPSSRMETEDLLSLRAHCGIPAEIELVLPAASESPELVRPEFCCGYEVYFKECGLCFLIPEILTHLMNELGVALPQLCPNIIREVVVLQTLAEEHGLPLDIPTLARVCMIRQSSGHKGNFYFAVKGERRVLCDRPPKDEKWQKRFFFFSVNEFSYGELSSLVKTTCTSSEDSGYNRARLRAFGPYNPNCKGYPSRQSRKMSLSYRQQRKAKELAATTKPAVQPETLEDRAQPEILEDLAQPETLEVVQPAEQQPIHVGSSRSSEKTNSSVQRKSPEIPPLTEDPQLAVVTIPPRVASTVSGLPAASSPLAWAPGSSRSRASSSSVPPRSGDGDTVRLSQLAKGSKRKALDSGSRSRGGSKKLRNYWDFGYNSNYLITENPASAAHLFRHFRKSGCSLPPLKDLILEDRINFEEFAYCNSQLLAAFNNTVSAYQTRVRAAPTSTDLTEAQATITTLQSELAGLRDEAAKNVVALHLSDEFFTHSRSLERKLKDAETFQAEKKCKELADTREVDLKVAACEAQKDLAIKFKETLDLVKSHIAGKDATLGPLVKVSETMANIELLEVIIKGEITDFQAELDVVSLDKQEKYAKDLAEAEVSVPKLDLSQIEILTSDLSPELATTSELPFDEFGNNAGSLLGVMRVDVPEGVEET
ncbi:unnamed protein product [Arabis nemorensis]|uniref:Uncharacterized protein n=1 Tax=Arabis nemorensis TaxID=586526 RepID=A0A565BTW2_9BRAS|nr:unnamed protein product [Arabis nemorensis]